MTNELKIIITVGVLLILGWNISLLTWTNTPSGTGDAELKLACAQGGGKVVVGGTWNYLDCKNPDHD